VWMCVRVCACSSISVSGACKESLVTMGKTERQNAEKVQP